MIGGTATRAGGLGALGAKLKGAGVDTDGAALYALAAQMLRRHGGSADRALGDFVAQVRAGGGLMAALHAPEETRRAARAYLEKTLRDMRGDMNPAKAGGDAQRVVESQHYSGVAEPSAQAEGSAHDLGECRKACGAPHKLPQGSGAAQPKSQSPRFSGRAAALSPAPARRGLAQLQAVREMAPSIFDTFKLRDGTPIGDCRWSSLPRLIGENAREAALLRFVKSHAVPADPNARVRDVISEETLKRFVQRAAEAQDNG